ncbi:hypothetical protein [Paenibacillus cookii]|uniref:hypothetical protein n=1 Tax=Paenibacillus cookii TaxID=157839 RepID=UPI0005445618|nr:hypothetical protein [Paenibacillus cookii]KHF31801.1 hypothetical protein CM49_06004 [Paenibacillus sp. P1XP2]
MKRKPLYWLLSCLMLIGLFPAGASAQTEPESVIYGGGPFYSGGTQTMDILKQAIRLHDRHVMDDPRSRQRRSLLQ